MAIGSKAAALLGAVGSALGLIFASLSTVDYARHLDRRLHEVHCSLVPGVSTSASEENPCRAAMYSVYSALLRETFWGGIPVALFAVGAFAFFAGFSVYLYLLGRSAPKRAIVFYLLTGLTPLLVSVGMFIIALTRLGSVCKTCAGIYISSLCLAIGAWLAWRANRRDTRAAVDPYAPTIHERMQVSPVASARSPEKKEAPQAGSSWSVPLVWLALLGVCTLMPAAVYASGVPDQRTFLRSCGKLEKPSESHGALVKLQTERAVRPALLFEDPLCPTCKALHRRMVDEGVFDHLDVQLSLFPLDSECNWMLATPLHPGACLLSRAVICGGDTARMVLEWAYDEQEDLAQLGRSGAAHLRARIVQKWGSRLGDCMDSAATKLKLNHQLHFAADNAVPVSTPQFYLSDMRICDEDTDLGLRYTLSELAPELLR